MWAKSTSAYILVWEVIGQLPGTTHGRARTKSAINNYLASGYVREPEGVARRGIGAEDPKDRPPRSSAKYDATRWRHYIYI